jgi:hypothetical protein
VRFSLGITLLPLLLLLTVAACSGGGGSNQAPPATTAAESGASPSASAADSPSSATVADPSAGAAKVNANTATTEELQAAFEAAGITNADRWAKEVAEYRPYPADPTWPQLRQELSKYNIAPDVLEKILAVLEV